MPPSRKKYWKSMDLMKMLLDHDIKTVEQLKQAIASIGAEDIFEDHQEYDVPMLKPAYYYLVFGKDLDRVEFDDNTLERLLGPDWSHHMEAYDETRKMVIDKDGFVLDFADVEPRYSLPMFNILSPYGFVQGHQISSNAPGPIPPVVILAIALSLFACKQGRGLFLWQRKSRGRSAKKTAWDAVPDLLYVDHLWQEDEAKAFRKSTYASKREYLCADLHLGASDVVLPFLLDFPQERRDKNEDARFPVSADNSHGPKASISIPDAAFVGWQADVKAPDDPNWGPRPTGKHPKPIVLDSAQRERTRVHDVAEMYFQIVSMFGRPVEDSLMLYSQVRELFLAARAEQK